jgi:predicted ATPase
MPSSPQTPPWYVITGGPSAGKTTVIDLLSQHGYATTIEEARYYINLEAHLGINSTQARLDACAFQQNILKLQIELESGLDQTQTTFLDRAIPDSLAYYNFLNLEPEPEELAAINGARYRKVFLLELLPLTPDYARTEDRDAQLALHALIFEVYSSRNDEIVLVPIMSPAERVNFILHHLQ